MAEINLLNVYPSAQRNYDQRAKEKTADVIKVAKEFGQSFFDGPRLYGYGGYRYDGRWLKVVKRMKKHYQLPDNAAILDVGCAKGFMLYDFLQYMPKCQVKGIDISSYAIDNALPKIKPYLQVASADHLPFEDNSFDLVISINTIHNLDLVRCKKALEEIQKIGRAHVWTPVTL